MTYAIFDSDKIVFAPASIKGFAPSMMWTMKTSIGIQQLQLGKICRSERSVQRSLVSLRQAGFETMELNGFMIRKTPLIARLLLSLSGMGIKRSQKLHWAALLREVKMSVISVHEDLQTLEEHMDLVEEEIELFQPKYIVVTGMYRFRYDSEEELGKLIVRLNRVGRRLSGLGVSLLYHNHSAEFQRIEGAGHAMDILLAGLNPLWVNFEFDSYWAIDAGADPLSWMDKMGKRIKLYHACDRGCRKEGPYLTPIVKTDAIELGFGSVHLDALIEKAKSLEVDAIILEQHRNYFADDPIASATISANYLKSERALADADSKK